MVTALAAWTGLFPWWWAWRSNRKTTLRPALLWALAAWAGWAGLFSLRWLAPDREATFERYLALCLTCCAGMAVLGARRPGVGAWHFVVGGLLAVLLLPIAQGLGAPRLHLVHWIFLTMTLAVGVVNYLPTNLGIAAMLFGCSVVMEMLQQGRYPVPIGAQIVGVWGLVSSPWVALLNCSRRRSFHSGLDRTWLEFRDRFGLFWALRAREQFNRAAAHAGWALRLGWQGQQLREVGTAPDQDVALATLQAVLKRFSKDAIPGSPPCDPV
jgi:hypothetical protein